MRNTAGPGRRLCLGVLAWLMLWSLPQSGHAGPERGFPLRDRLDDPPLAQWSVGGNPSRSGYAGTLTPPAAGGAGYTLMLRTSLGAKPGDHVEAVRHSRSGVTPGVMAARFRLLTPQTAATIAFAFDYPTAGSERRAELRYDVIRRRWFVAADGGLRPVVGLHPLVNPARWHRVEIRIDPRMGRYERVIVDGRSVQLDGVPPTRRPTTTDASARHLRWEVRLSSQGGEASVEVADVLPVPPVGGGPPSIAVVRVHGPATDPGLFQGMTEGLRRASVEFAHIPQRVFDVTAGEANALTSFLRSISMQFRVVVVVGWVEADVIRALGNEFPDVRYVAVDAQYIRALTPASRLHYTSFREEQGAFIAGALAGLITRTGRVGCIGAVDRFPYRAHLDGFKAGVAYTARKTRLLRDYVATDLEAALQQAKWQQVASAQFELGADVVYATGAPSLAALLRAAGPGRWVIGSGSVSPAEVSTEMEQRLLMRVTKDYGLAVFHVVRTVAAEAQAGGYTRHTVRDGGVGYVLEAPAESAVRVHVPRLEQIARRVFLGTIKVPYDPGPPDVPTPSRP